MEKNKKKIIKLFSFLAILALFLAPLSSSFFVKKYVVFKTGMNVKLSYFLWLNMLKEGVSIEFSNAIGGVGFALPIVVFFILILLVIMKKENRSIHGQSRLANTKDLEDSGFLDCPTKSKHPSILIGQVAEGKHKGKYLHYSGQQFLMLYAPTRSGKGVGIVIPNCIHYPESIVVLDIKLENFLFTAGHRAKFSEVYLFAPAGWNKDRNGVYRSHRYNPLAYINRDLVERGASLAIISSILFPVTGGENDMWTQLSENLFAGLVLYLLDLEDQEGSLPVTLPSVLRVSVPPNNEVLGDWLKKEVEKRNSPSNKMAWQKYCLEPESFTEEKPLKPLNDDTILKLSSFYTKPDKQRESIKLTFDQKMSIFTNKITAEAMSGNDFDFKDVRRKKMSIYLGIPPNAVKTYAPIANLFFSQLIAENTSLDDLPEHDPSLKYQCLMVLDEFTSMGKVSIIEQSVAYTAGYNMRYLFILQNREQLESQENYGKEGASTLIANCAVELIYPPRVVTESLRNVSETLGYYDYVTTSKSRTRQSGGSSNTVQEQINKRAVLSPQEIIELGEIKHKTADLGIKQIILNHKTKPIVADKIIYFDDDYFNTRKEYSLQNIPPIPTLNLDNRR